MRASAPCVALISTLLMFFVGTPARGQDRVTCTSPDIPSAHVVAIDGEVDVITRSGEKLLLRLGDAVCPGDQITTGAVSRVEIQFEGANTTTGASSATTIIIPVPNPDTSDVRLVSGLMRFISSVRGVFKISTPFQDAGIDGTEAVLAVDGAAEDSLILVREGFVTVSDRRDSGVNIRLAQGEASFAGRETRTIRATPENVPAKFRPLLLNPESASDWAIHYPPILLAAGVTAPVVTRAAALLDVGDADGADALLTGLSLTPRDAAAALALRSVTAVFRNKPGEGAVLADAAVERAPNLGAAHIARSYALQAMGQLEAARASAEQAVAVSPEDAYAWARLAELHLTLGGRYAAQQAARQSILLAETSLGRTIEGFAALSVYDYSATNAAFHRAIEIDSEAPLPHLGLGLAAIRQGRPEDGRREIETAVALDPRRASLRTWLGRAYFEEGRGDKATAQFALALQEDPDDANAAFFSALQLFGENRPVEALNAVRAAQDRTKGRAVIRSRQGLGEDRAVQGAALGRIYDVLGFHQLAVQEGSRAVDADPANSAAHFFLSDVYRTRPGFEVAQTSELLRAQLLAPPNSNPIQPSLAEADLALLETGGPARVTFHEFSPLFQSDGFNFVGSGALGNNGVIGDEISLALKHGDFSVSAGQYHFSSDGFRANDDVNHDVVSLIAKAQVTPNLSLTGELRIRRTESGDRFLRSFSDESIPVTRTEFERSLFRLGGHAEINTRNDVIFYGLYADTDSAFSATFIDPFFGPITSEETTDGESLAFEVQEIFDFGRGNLVTGASVGRNKEDVFFDGFFALEEDVDQLTLYAYSSVDLFKGLEATLGVSYDHTIATENDLIFGEKTDRKFSQINPKIGVRTEIVDGVIVRGAYSRTLKRDFISDQTLEPTTISGFNQFFDDFDRTDAHMLGAGADIRLRENLWLGGEYIYRSLDIPVIDLSAFPPAPIMIDGKERTVRGYLNATIGDHWSASGGVEFVRNETDIFDRPDQVDTLLVPVSVSYFDNSGVFGSIEAIYFDQSSEGEVSNDFGDFVGVDTDESGVILNATLGFRHPSTRTVASIEVNNLLGENLQLQNNLNNSARPSTRPLAEDVSVIGRFTIGF